MHFSVVAAAGSMQCLELSAGDKFVLLLSPFHKNGIVYPADQVTESSRFNLSRFRAFCWIFVITVLQMQGTSKKTNRNHQLRIYLPHRMNTTSLRPREQVEMPSSLSSTKFLLMMQITSTTSPETTNTICTKLRAE